jgi:hypothetical protein
VIPGPTPRVKPDDKRRTMRSYGHNLFYNLRDVLAPRNFKPLLIAAAITAPSFLLDDEGKQYFQDHPHENWGKIGATAGGTLAMAGLTVGVFSAGRISRGDRFRSMSYDLSQAIIVTQLYTQGLKFAVGRERPDGSNNLSFPSGHSSNAFTAATVAAIALPEADRPRIRPRHVHRAVAHGGETSTTSATSSPARGSAGYRTLGGEAKQHATRSEAGRSGSTGTAEDHVAGDAVAWAGRRRQRPRAGRQLLDVNGRSRER